jgi:hypothetical protein
MVTAEQRRPVVLIEPTRIQCTRLRRSQVGVAPLPKPASTSARACLLAQFWEQNRRFFDAQRGQKVAPHQPHVTTRGTRVERPTRATTDRISGSGSLGRRRQSPRTSGRGRRLGVPPTAKPSTGGRRVTRCGVLRDQSPGAGGDRDVRLICLMKRL